MKINWTKLWEEYDLWWDNCKSKRCKTCRHILGDYPEWEDQAEKIEQLVNEQMKETENERVSKLVG